MSFTSIPVIANDKNKPECMVFFSLLKGFLMLKLLSREKTDSIFKSYNFNEIVCW